MRTYALVFHVTSHDITIRYCIRFNLYVTPFQYGKPEEFLKWYEKVHFIWRQNQVTTAANKYGILKTVLKGTALEVVETSMGDEQVTNAKLKEAIDALKKLVFPHQALQTQKRYMKKDLKKPFSMDVREFFNRVNTLNRYLHEFPGADADSHFNEEDMQEILVYAMPAMWRSRMDEVGFDPFADDVTQADLLAKVEALERYQRKIMSQKGSRKP